ncbi:Putative NACHT nucleoside triphosphatase, P-loop containing nucleoside triphosphate hydrolase [Colletotrichum destructivum]|uniref:NACHT nucleoside triphosphatase, P-loop containing nucleoside triphosphate hydrolase n=1 Tax=Colletotrichum destructivum TaxID=34406 RepID=A0AAX4I156_9PEZI|nr:Putative NACHT nucleoside triphosphatase, P-loop containing nucleoside triphosphate hydrolase [Colletotrichum destructivum]
MAVAQALRPSGDDFWAAAISTLGDDLTSEIDFTGGSKQTPIDELLAATKEARDGLDAKSWSFTRNGKKVIVRDLLTKVAKWVHHFKEVGDIAVQYDPGHAALPWAGVRFLLNVAVGDLDTYSSILERTVDIAELICRNALIESLLKSVSTAAAEELRRALVKLYATILTYLAKARSYYRKNTAARVIKHGVLASADLDSAFTAITEAQQDVTQCSAVFGLEAQFEMHGELKQMLKGFNDPVKRWNEALSALTDQLDLKRRVEILRWLSDEPHQQHHQQTYGEVMEGTGKWLLQDPTFLQWKNESASSILWLHGIPGSGKSKLTSIVVKDAQDAFSNNQTPAPVYFYCSRNPAEPGRSDPSRIVASFARQLSTPVARGPLLEDAVRVYQKREEDAFASGPLHLEESKDLIIKLLDQYKYATMTIVIDALDECAEASRGRLLELLEDLLMTSPCLLKIFVSSRDDQDIVYRLDTYPNLHLSSDRNSEDIDLFVRTETTHLIGRGELLRSSTRKRELRDKIVNELTDNAHGMFRWASLQLQELCRQRTDEAIVERLGRLPKTLEDLYREILSRIEGFEAETDRLLTRSALSWLLCGQEQLKSDCFLAAVCLTKHDAAYRISKTQLLELCCNLVLYDSTQDAFQFSHLSVREFLESQTVYQLVAVNALVAESCLYIVDEMHKYPVSNPLLEYCDRFWAEHAQKGLHGEQETLTRTLHFFLSKERGTTQVGDWQKRIQRSTARKSLGIGTKLQSSIRTIPSVLLVVCAFDLAGVLSLDEWTHLSTRDPGAFRNTHQEVAAKHGEGKIVAWHLDRNIPFETGEITLTAVAENRGSGHKIMALLLDKRGDEIRITEDVVEAAAENKESGKEIMALLLDKRGDEIRITEDVVEAAAENDESGKEIMALLLDKRGDEVRITENVVKAAAENRRSGQQIMALLLDKRGDEIQITEGMISTIVRTFNHAVVGLLLDKRGDEIQITEVVVKAAAANWRSGRQIIALLLDKRGDEVQITEDVVKTAAEYGSYETMALLLDKRGDEVQITEDVIKAAAGNENSGKEIMELLLDKRGDEVQITQDVVKAAAANLNHGQQIMALLLDKRGDEIQITEVVVKAAAQTAACKQLVGYLLTQRSAETRASITSQACFTASACGQLVSLHYLCQYIPLEKVEPLWDDIGRLYRAAETGNADEIEKLLETAVPLNTRDSFGRTPLWIAAGNGRAKVVELLCQQSEVDVDSLSSSGRSPIFWPSACGNERIVTVLLSAGAKTDFIDAEGQTAVSMARQNGHGNIVRLLLSSEAAKQPKAAWIWVKAWRSWVSRLLIVALLCLVGTVGCAIL